MGFSQVFLDAFLDMYLIEMRKITIMAVTLSAIVPLHVEFAQPLCSAGAFAKNLVTRFAAKRGLED